MLKSCLAELLGTFLLVLVGCGAMVIEELNILPIGGLEISLAFGLIVLICILLFARVSGAHINPAVSLYFYWIEEIKLDKLLYFVVFQMAGATLAAVVLMLLNPESEFLGSTFPHVGITKTWLLEFFMTFLLIGLLHKVKNLKVLLIAALIGTLIFLEAYLGGPSTGASMNPARSFGPLLMSNNMNVFWIYLSSQVAAVGLAIGLIRIGKKPSIN